jgi:hypothetical protein
MNGIRRILAALAGILLALAAAPAAFASLPPHGGRPADGAQPPVQVIAGGGMPGWQITLIAAAAALAAILAVLLDRARMARKAHAATG